MNRDDLIDLCEQYVRRRGLGTLHISSASMPPVLEIVESFLDAEISASEKNSLLAFVRSADHDDEHDTGFGEEVTLGEVDGAVIAELDEAVLAKSDDSGD